MNSETIPAQDETIIDVSARPESSNTPESIPLSTMSNDRRDLPRSLTAANVYNPSFSVARLQEANVAGELLLLMAASSIPLYHLFDLVLPCRSHNDINLTKRSVGLFIGILPLVMQASPVANQSFI